jgi:hypothetical protein
MFREHEESKEYRETSYKIWKDPNGWWYEIPGQKAKRLSFTFEVGLVDDTKQKEAVIKEAQEHIDLLVKNK